MPSNKDGHAQESTDDEPCPVGFASFTDGAGRFMVPSSHSGSPMASADQPLASGEDRAHGHSTDVSVDVPNVGYAAIEGCCNSGYVRIAIAHYLSWVRVHVVNGGFN